MCSTCHALNWADLEETQSRTSLWVQDGQLLQMIDSFSTLNLVISAFVSNYHDCQLYARQSSSLEWVSITRALHKHNMAFVQSASAATNKRARQCAVCYTNILLSSPDQFCLSCVPCSWTRHLGTKRTCYNDISRVIVYECKTAKTFQRTGRLC